MTEPTEKTVTFEVTLTVSYLAALRAAALKYYLAGGGAELGLLKTSGTRTLSKTHRSALGFAASLIILGNMGRASTKLTMSISASFISRRRFRKALIRRHPSAARRSPS